MKELQNMVKHWDNFNLELLEKILKIKYNENDGTN